MKSDSNYYKQTKMVNQELKKINQINTKNKKRKQEKTHIFRRTTPIGFAGISRSPVVVIFFLHRTILKPPTLPATAILILLKPILKPPPLLLPLLRNPSSLLAAIAVGIALILTTSSLLPFLPPLHRLLPVVVVVHRSPVSTPVLLLGPPRRLVGPLAPRIAVLAGLAGVGAAGFAVARGVGVGVTVRSVAVAAVVIGGVPGRALVVSVVGEMLAVVAVAVAIFAGAFGGLVFLHC